MRDKYTAAILAFLLGGLGAHKFYLGRWGWGLIYLFFCWTFIPAVIGFLESIVLLSMSKIDFENKYNTNLIMTPSGIVQASPDTHVKCPDCRELVIKDARKCRHCGCILTPQ